MRAQLRFPRTELRKAAAVGDTSARSQQQEALEHARAWFITHSVQRMQTFNFFLVATAFLVAGYATILEKRPAVAVAIGAAGVWITYWFLRLDRRNRQLVDAGEAAIMPLERRLSAMAGVPDH